MRRAAPPRRAGLWSMVTLVMSLPMALGLFLVVAAASPVAAAPTLKGYTPVSPLRICDSRPFMTGVVAVNQCNNGGLGATLGKGAITVAVAGVNAVPITAVAVVLNVTATNTTAASFLTVWPTGLAQPGVSNLNWTAGQTVPNLVEVAVGASGSVNVYNNAGATDVVIDLEGYVDASAPGLFSPLPPARICDTRHFQPTVTANQCQGLGGRPGTLGVGRIVVTVNGGVPATATAAVLNVTVTDTTSAGFLTVWPDGSARPLASNLNWVPGQTIPNRVIVPLGPGNKIDVYNSAGATDVVIDVNGYYSATPGGSGYTPFVPARVCDTRPVGPGVVSNVCNNPANLPNNLSSMDEITLVAPAGVTGQVFNVTVVNTTGASYLTVFPDPSPSGFSKPPLISDLNWVPGQVAANLVVVGSGAGGAITFYNNSGSTDLVVDLQGQYKTTPTAASAVSVQVTHRRATTAR